MKSVPIYVKPQITSDAGSCRINVMVGIRNDPGKMIDSINVQFQLPPCVLSADLTSNHGAVNILSSKVSALNLSGTHLAYQLLSARAEKCRTLSFYLKRS